VSRRLAGVAELRASGRSREVDAMGGEEGHTNTHTYTHRCGGCGGVAAPHHKAGGAGQLLNTHHTRTLLRTGCGGCGGAAPHHKAGRGAGASARQEHTCTRTHMHMRAGCGGCGGAAPHHKAGRGAGASAEPADQPCGRAEEGAGQRLPGPAAQGRAGAEEGDTGGAAVWCGLPWLLAAPQPLPCTQGVLAGEQHVKNVKEGGVEIQEVPFPGYLAMQRARSCVCLCVGVCVCVWCACACACACACVPRAPYV